MATPGPELDALPGMVSLGGMSHTIKEKENLLLRAKRIQGQVEASEQTSYRWKKHPCRYCRNSVPAVR